VRPVEYVRKHLEFAVVCVDRAKYGDNECRPASSSKKYGLQMVDVKGGDVKRTQELYQQAWAGSENVTETTKIHGGMDTVGWRCWNWLRAVFEKE
jgi:hypothetical protein